MEEPIDAEHTWVEKQEEKHAAYLETLERTGEWVRIGGQGTIKFTAAVWKVSTLADGGIRLVLDLEEGARDIMGELARCQQNGIVLKIEAEKDES